MNTGTPQGICIILLYPVSAVVGPITKGVRKNFLKYSFATSFKAWKQDNHLIVNSDFSLESVYL